MTGAQQEQKYQKYIQGIIKAIQEDPKSLDKLELTVGHKYLESQQQLQRLVQEKDQTLRQIEQLRSKETQLNSMIDTEVGKGGGYIDTLVAMKYAEADGQEVPEPLLPNRKAKRATTSQAKKAAKQDTQKASLKKGSADASN